MVKKKYDLSDIGLQGTVAMESIVAIPLESLSEFHEKEHIIFSNTHQPRCTLYLESKVAHGSYGNLYLAKRTPYGSIDEKQILVKQPRMAEMNLTQEGVLQHISQILLEKEGMGGAVPRVYDIFKKGHQVWFSMELIYGISIQELFQTTKHADLDFFLLIAQMSMLLWCLEHHLGLDHRDLKVDNLLVKVEPCTLTFHIKDHTWSLVSPFRIVLLDFGFACLGSEENPEKPILNLGDGVLPPMDPCPKEGRDLFQLLISLLGLKEFNEKISKPVHEKIDKWLSIGKKSYGTMARRWSTENWTYLVTSQRNFSISSCCPENILRDLLPEVSGYLQRS